MLDVILEHSKWIFSGIGVVVLSLIFKCVFSRKKVRKNNVQKSKNNSTNYIETTSEYNNKQSTGNDSKNTIKVVD